MRTARLLTGFCVSRWGSRVVAGWGGVAKGRGKFTQGPKARLPSPHPCSLGRSLVQRACLLWAPHRSRTVGVLTCLVSQHPVPGSVCSRTDSVKSPWKPKVTKIIEAPWKSGETIGKDQQTGFQPCPPPHQPAQQSWSHDLNCPSPSDLMKWRTITLTAKGRASTCRSPSLQIPGPCPPGSCRPWGSPPASVSSPTLCWWRMISTYLVY